MTLGTRIKAKRHALKLTQRDLAAALGVTPQHISAMEQDRRAPSLPFLVKVAKELGVTIDYLLTGRESVIQEPIGAIKADRRLSLNAKRAFIELLQEIYEARKDAGGG